MRTHEVGPGDKPLVRLMLRDIRATREEDEIRIGGFGLKWDDEYRAGWFSESFSRGAFASSLNGVPLLMGHDRSGVPLAKSQGTMTLTETDAGLEFDAVLDARSPHAMSVFSAVERGDLDGASVGFFPIREEKTHSEYGPTHYEVLEAELVELSLTPFPAYESSSVEPRGAPELREPEPGVTVDERARKAREYEAAARIGRVYH